VVQLAWEFGRRGALIGVALATALWVWASFAGEWTYGNDWLRFYNGATRAVVYLAVAEGILLLRRTIERHREQMAAMRALLDVCHGCGAVRGSDDAWVPMDRLVEYSARRVRVQECPACHRGGH